MIARTVKRGGKRAGAGRPKTTGTGEILPWRMPPGTITRIRAAATASGRTPAQVLRDAIEMLPVK